jgi:hypothetical protein
VQRKGENVAILVDSADMVDAAELDRMLEQLEEIIYVRAVALFGDPPLTDGSSQTASDRNADGLLWIVLTSKVADMGDAVGFFVATDFTEDASSNQADILYVNSDQVGAAADRTMAHELQHLLSYGAKAYKPEVNGGGGSLEALWLDEGQSHFSEDACGFPGENTTLLDQEVFTAFSETQMFSDQDSLAMRGLAMLFVRYLFEQEGAVQYDADGTITDQGGAAFLQGLHNSSELGLDAVEAVHGDAKGAFANWAVAVGLDNRGVTDDSRFVYQDLVDDPKTGNKLGVKIRGPREDETGAEVNLLGPLEEEITGDTQGTIPSSTARYYVLTGQSGTVDVTVESQAEDFGFALVKLEQQ